MLKFSEGLAKDKEQGLNAMFVQVLEPVTERLIHIRAKLAKQWVWGV